MLKPGKGVSYSKLDGCCLNQHFTGTNLSAEAKQ